MPRIENVFARESCHVGWQNKKGTGETSLMGVIRPKFKTGDQFTTNYGQLPFRQKLKSSQVYSSDSRSQYVDQLQKMLDKLPCETTLQIRWRVSKEVPAFSMDFLYLYLSRFGQVQAMYQLANNAALVVFRNVQTARLVRSCLDLGLPYGRLYAKLWNPTSQDQDYYRVMKHVEKAAEVKARFNLLLDKDDRLVMASDDRDVTRAIAESYRASGPNLKSYLTIGVGITEALNPPLKTIYKGKLRVHTIQDKGEFDDVIRSSRQLVVVDFYANWCGPCKKVAPYIDRWATEYSHVSFVKVNVDEGMEISEMAGVDSLPTFHFYKDGSKLGQVVGADVTAIKMMIDTYS
ncbi:uncharacterized protein LOC131936931 [Physella acuta]|uniref:uncharacterized protein LOC131936931 n=1 Tax=Physella acuta TaxID=109671 RepID=UPI0027DE5D20|nr:uncharacterized protein LOC131936931 [Physella acuta]XP_059150052.1 uncharacterized protein LOC131936931 [Physella acuta]